MNDVAESQQVAREHISRVEPSFCRTCPTRASCMAVCDQLEALLRETCNTQVSVKTAAFGDLGIAPEGLPSDQDRRFRGYIT
jgi:hypothetical protein